MIRSDRVSRFTAVGVGVSLLRRLAVPRVGQHVITELIGSFIYKHEETNSKGIADVQIHLFNIL